ncbi:MAG: hypothetical protein IJI75_11905 [Solobacterium sp.]|nr:hypothetical protein [Solobacterium sp.]MBQ6489914.1 hypothetical protein [Solobacterium sp.]MCR5448253.1 hypothetical protein [Solobacterium sp.]MDO4191778.1 hypothetical protein [Erysipelotrichaceae bacterium]MDO5120622.1 hypothetical protein [Erysipelotrichaceae bacterium]
MRYEEVVSNVCVYGFDESVRGSKYPMATDLSKVSEEVTERTLKLANAPAGSGHDNFLNGVIVQFDLTFTNKAWVEAERYHFLDFVSSQSTMHRITKFDLDRAYIEYTDPRIIEIMKEKTKEYNDLQNDIKRLQEEGKDTGTLMSVAAEKYLEILYSNPAGFKLTARMTTNYRQLKTIYAQRKNHRLPEWRAFCEWIETLPNADFITKTMR